MYLIFSLILILAEGLLSIESMLLDWVDQNTNAIKDDNIEVPQVQLNLTITKILGVAGLLVLLHHNLTLPFAVGKKKHVYVPVRKRVKCRTRDVHQSLLVKLNRAQNKQPQNVPLVVPMKPKASAPSINVVNSFFWAWSSCRLWNSCQAKALLVA